MNYYTRVIFQNYFNFNGRDSRKQYWMFVLINFIISCVLGAVAAAIGDGGTIITSAYSLALLLPSLGICVRRLHDIGKSGFWYLIAFIPVVGVILLIVWFCQPSQAGENQYGAEPIE